MSGFAPLLGDKRKSNPANPGVSVYEYTPLGDVLGRACLARRGGHYRAPVRLYLVLVGSYL